MRARAIGFCLRNSRLGRLLVAGTSRGVCLVEFGGLDGALRQRLREEFPFATFEARPDRSLRRWADAIVRYVDGVSPSVSVPLDVRGSRFQKRVWAALRGIPRGETRSYSDIARQLRLARGGRAVARACATNPVPVITPCHRVIEKRGGLGGYAGGVARKRALLDLEGAR